MALKHYSHYRNSDAATNMWEVVSPALFEVYLTFPKNLNIMFKTLRKRRKWK